MPLSSGTRIGPYEVVGALGAGGMGEVYRARDAKLGRDVALKILPDLFSSDAERQARFRREATLLASLNHPNIGHVYGFEDGTAPHALVLELVEGPTLAERLTQGRLDVPEALSIARQIADVMQAAHEAGVIHRDLKPANIKIRPDGTVKVLDFGLAKALAPIASSSDFTNSPTITSPAHTAMGMVLGTAAYMSPEQARGRAVDRRADIWAFGCVLFEMLAPRLYVRRLADDQMHAVPGSDGGYGLFFSPDGEQIAFTVAGKLWRAPVAGGAAFEIGTVNPADRGAVWSSDGFIYSGGASGLSRISVSGGTREPLTTINTSSGEVGHRFPAVVPGRNAVLFTIFKGALDDARVGALDLDTKAVHVVLDLPGHGPQVTSTGHLLYLRSGVLMAAPFDASRLQVIGTPEPVLNGVAFNSGGASHFAVSNAGTLVYVPEPDPVTDTALAWADRAGKLTVADVPPAPYVAGAISPDGGRVALVRVDPRGQAGIVVWNVSGRTVTNVTREAAEYRNPVWTPDGRSIVFTHRPQIGGFGRMLRQRADGSADAAPVLARSPTPSFGSSGDLPGSFSSDGKTLFYAELAVSSPGIWVVDIETGADKQVFAALATGPRISPDGRWLALLLDPSSGSSATGPVRTRAAVVPYPEVSRGHSAVGSLGATGLRWSPDGQELFYLEDQGDLFATFWERAVAHDGRPEASRSIAGTNRLVRRRARRTTFSRGSDRWRDSGADPTGHRQLVRSPEGGPVDEREYDESTDARVGRGASPCPFDRLPEVEDALHMKHMRTKRPLREPVREAPGPKLKNYITPAGFERLKDEHRFLMNRERPAMTEVVAWAAGNGDRSENADYLYGKRRLRQIDSRIRFLTKRIDAAEVIDPAAPRSGSAATRAFFGATVTYRDAAGHEHIISIVGIDEVDLNHRYISWMSPLARALMKSSPGDRVVLRAPTKTDHLEIIDVEYAAIPMDPFREPPGAESAPRSSDRSRTVGTG